MVDKALECVKLRWSVNNRDDPWIHVQPTGAIIGRVHVVPDGVHVYAEAECSSSAEKAHTWIDRGFYIDRFKYSNYESKYMLEDRTIESGVMDEAT